MAELGFTVDNAKSARSLCRHCDEYIDKKALRIGKFVKNFYDEDDEGWGDLTYWHHAVCMFKAFDQDKPKDKKIKSPDDMYCFNQLNQEDKKTILKLINDANVKWDNLFRQFRCLCAKLSDEDTGAGKTAIVSDFLKKGNAGTGFKGDVYLLMKFLLPGVVKTVYNLNDKDLIKLFSQIFGTNLKAMEEDLEQGDVSETVRVCFDKSKTVTPLKKSVLTLQEADDLLTSLSQVTKESEQYKILTKIVARCTSNDLMMVVRLITHDLGINAKAKYILRGLHPDAYKAFQVSQNLKDVVERVQSNTLHSMAGMKKKKTDKKTGHDHSKSEGAKQGISGSSDSVDVGVSKKKTPVKRPTEDEGQTTPSKKCKTAPSASPSMSNIFTDCKIFLPETTDKFKELKQYIIDFDGEVLDETSKGSATHIVSSKGKISTSGSKAKVVTPDWLWQSIKKKQLASTEEFKP
ncbi:DNA ligase 3-like isoform X2 [Haliotis rubra]|uniref:DNA ligase 3-like isoform X2 n=1 Tax=Haliotis rubra TaxID=36100 RepID=UPI001EE526E5|nr:DNA ligase 3-like isoform X2 [Haliotis rubra]